MIVVIEVRTKKKHPYTVSHSYQFFHTSDPYSSDKNEHSLMQNISDYTDPVIRSTFLLYRIKKNNELSTPMSVDSMM